MTLQLLEGSLPVWGFFEAVRILASQTTDITSGPMQGRVAITITPDTQDPIPVAAEGPSQIPSGAGGTFNASTAVSVDAYQWYLNGGPIPEETNPWITIGSGLGDGTCRLDLMVTKGNIDSSRSASFTIGVSAAPGPSSNKAITF